MKSFDGKTLTSKPEILAEIEGYYGTLSYKNQQPDPEYDDPTAILTRYFTEELPDICLDEIELALEQLKLLKTGNHC
ncbi:unnamed protein product [Parnassius apollo]|uniref:(apollo) hypothetical protein n=1 Tax=Parnassius apollo TaxID=110799 RepID=A0A8S3WM97_PARAO|nr:unnamed protein product [Parnassius apollo]